MYFMKYDNFSMKCSTCITEGHYAILYEHSRWDLGKNYQTTKLNFFHKREQNVFKCLHLVYYYAYFSEINYLS